MQFFTKMHIVIYVLSILGSELEVFTYNCYHTLRIIWCALGRPTYCSSPQHLEGLKLHQKEDLELEC